MTRARIFIGENTSGIKAMELLSPSQRLMAQAIAERAAELVLKKLDRQSSLKDERWLSPRQAADLLGWSRDYLYEQKDKHDFGYTKAGGRLRFPESKIRAYIENR